MYLSSVRNFRNQSGQMYHFFPCGDGDLVPGAPFEALQHSKNCSKESSKPEHAQVPMLCRASNRIKYVVCFVFKFMMTWRSIENLEVLTLRSTTNSSFQLGQRKANGWNRNFGRLEPGPAAAEQNLNLKVTQFCFLSHGPCVYYKVEFQVSKKYRSKQL